MKHLDDIRVFIDVLLASSSFHALVIESPPGWGKSSAVAQILAENGNTYERIGTYTTAFHLYNALKRSPDKLFVLDDCVGILSDPTALAVLKSATWAVGGPCDLRLLSWGSGAASEVQESVEFSGKLVLLVNSVGYGTELRGLLSRVLYLQVLTNLEDKHSLLLEAAKNTKMYACSAVAEKVAVFLINKISSIDASNLNFRTLRLGYELAEKFPEKWESLLEKLLTGTHSPLSIVQGLARTSMPVEQQVKRFKLETGLSRRTFFNYRKTSSN